MLDLEHRLEKMKEYRFEQFTFEIDKSKIRELALSLGDLREGYLNGTEVPPTFPAVIEFWGQPESLSEKLGLNLSKVLHGEQSYEYLAKLSVGDVITVKTVVEKTFSKSKMNFIVLRKDFINQADEHVLTSRQTIIERH